VEERRAFVRVLVEEAWNPDRRALILVGLRADFFGSLAPYVELADLVGPNHVLLGPMGTTELRRAIERVAAQRRALPAGGAVPDDYRFEEAVDGGGDVRFSELFAPGKDTLVIYSFMFPRAPDEDLPCPSCTQFLDSFDGVAEHFAQRANLAIVAKASLRQVPLLRFIARAGGVVFVRRREDTPGVNGRLDTLRLRQPSASC